MPPFKATANHIARKDCGVRICEKEARAIALTNVQKLTPIGTPIENHAHSDRTATAPVATTRLRAAPSTRSRRKIASLPLVVRTT
jgi:hypothetical protein